jgi:hypothetical protein
MIIVAVIRAIANLYMHVCVCVCVCVYVCMCVCVCVCVCAYLKAHTLTQPKKGMYSKTRSTRGLHNPGTASRSES